MASHSGGVADASPYLGSITPVVMLDGTGSSAGSHRSALACPTEMRTSCISRVAPAGGRGDHGLPGAVVSGTAAAQGTAINRARARRRRVRPGLTRRGAMADTSTDL